MAHIRAPLVGDPVYGGRPRLPLAPSKPLQDVLQGFRRQALHATRLSFAHPIDQTPLKFECAVPADFQNLIDILAQDRDAASATQSERKS
jgi:23S rRNA pseudouridine1911/1915/1917 synthase